MRVTLAKQQRHSPPLRGPSLKGGLFFRLPLGAACFPCVLAYRACRRIEYPLLRGRIKGGGSLMRGVSPGLPLGEAGSCHETDGRLKRVLNFLWCPGCDTCPVYFCGVQPGFES